ncbi:MAG TPA: hypothetical protein VGF79_12965 [Bacteroidia bacterium]
MNKKVLLPILIGLCLFLGVLVYKSINDRIVYLDRVKEIDAMVIGRLDTLRKMELAYRDMKGNFAGSFKELFDFMENGKYYKIKEVGDNDGEVVNVQRDTTFLDPKLEILGDANINLERFKLVPPMDTAIFKIYAGTIEQSNVIVPVFEIQDPHPFNKDIKPLKVGDKTSAVTSGNWK